MGKVILRGRRWGIEPWRRRLRRAASARILVGGAARFVEICCYEQRRTREEPFLPRLCPIVTPHATALNAAKPGASWPSGSSHSLRPAKRIRMLGTETEA